MELQQAAAGQAALPPFSHDPRSQRVKLQCDPTIRRLQTNFACARHAQNCVRPVCCLKVAALAGLHCWLSLKQFVEGTWTVSSRQRPGKHNSVWASTNRRLHVIHAQTSNVSLRVHRHSIQLLQPAAHWAACTCANLAPIDLHDEAHCIVYGQLGAQPEIVSLRYCSRLRKVQFRSPSCNLCNQSWSHVDARHRGGQHRLTQQELVNGHARHNET